MVVTHCGAGAKYCAPTACVSDCVLMVCTYYIPKACLYKQMAFEMHRKNLIAGFVDAMRFVCFFLCYQKRNHQAKAQISEKLTAKS